MRCFKVFLFAATLIAVVLAQDLCKNPDQPTLPCTRCEENICRQCQEKFYEDEDGGCGSCDTGCGGNGGCHGEGIQNCDACPTDYYLDEEDNCVSCDGNKDCQDCGDGYYYPVVNGNCKKCDDTCETCEDVTAKCTKCAQEHYRVGNDCVSCEGNEDCKQCKSGYYTNEGGDCVSCNGDENCEACKQAGTYKDGDLCKQCPEEDTDCQSCKNGYYKIEGVCVKCGQGDEVCTACNGNGYVTIEDGDYCLKCADGCAECTAEDACTKCPPENTHDENGCHSCGEGEENCKQCKAGYIKVPNDDCVSCTTFGQDGCADCAVSLLYKDGDFCKLCPDDSVDCAKCRSGYYKDGGVCKKCSEDDETDCEACNGKGYSTIGEGDEAYCLGCNAICDKCDANGACTTCAVSHRVGAACDQCEKGYYIKDDGCDQCMGNCEACSSATVCTECKEGYYVKTEETSATCEACSSSIDHCQKCSAGNVCTKCEDGYYLKTDESGTKCEKCDDKCGTCNSAESCLSCANTYYDKSSDPTKVQCEPREGNCDGDICNCEDGSYFVKVSAKCMACNEKCSKCASSSDACTECAAGWYNSATEPEVTCTKCDSPCATCNGDTVAKCMSCVDGYYFDSSDENEKCKACDVSCKKCDSAAQCTECVTNGDVIDGGVCRAQCPEGKLQYGKKCVTECPPNAYEDEEEHKCVDCDTGCEKCTKDKCTECSADYYNTDGTVCVYCADSGCVCGNRQYLDSDRFCKKCKDANCAKCNANKCEVCDDGFVVTDAGACEKPPEQNVPSGAEAKRNWSCVVVMVCLMVIAALF